MTNTNPVYPMWMIVNPPFRHGEPKPVYHIGDMTDPEEALERAGEILSSMNASDVRIRMVRVPLTTGYGDAVEIYDPSSVLGVVVIGVTFADEQQTDTMVDPWWDRPMGHA